jgi:uncharacterized ParB-like nuclease family protein
MALRLQLGRSCIKKINKGKTMTERIKLEKIRLDGNTQPRQEIDEQLVQSYTEKLLDGKVFTPIDLWFDGKFYWPSDGFHRYHAHKRAGYKDIEAIVKTGTKREAFIACLPANSKHGKQRTPEETRYSVRMALEDWELGEKSDAEIAVYCDTSAMTVGRVRKALGLEKAVRVNKKGQKVDVTKIGRKKEEVPFWPAAPVYTEEDKMQEMAKEHTIIAEENAKLKDQLAIKSLPVSTTAKKEIEETIESLRAQVKDLEFQLRTMTQSRNEFQSKNAEMIKQMAYWKKRAEKAEKK